MQTQASRMMEGALDPHTYNGFSSPPERRFEPQPAPTPRRRPGGGKSRAAALLAGALLLGAVVGLGSRSLLEQRREVAEPMAQAPPPGPLAPFITPPDPAAAPIPSASLPATLPSLGPAFPCTGQLRPSERMVCDDAVLSDLDRQLNAAFARAVRAGAPRAALRAEQDQWVFRREAVARRSHAALVSYYQTRIAELNALASPPS